MTGFKSHLAVSSNCVGKFDSCRGTDPYVPRIKLERPLSGPLFVCRDGRKTAERPKRRGLPLRRERIVAVRVALGDLAVPVVDDVLYALAAGLVATGLLRGGFGGKRLRDARCALATICPPITVGTVRTAGFLLIGSLLPLLVSRPGSAGGSGRVDLRRPTSTALQACRTGPRMGPPTGVLRSASPLLDTPQRLLRKA